MNSQTTKLIVPATLDKLEHVLAFIDKELEEHNCSMKSQMQIDIAVEEIYINIARYAYGDTQEGNVTILCRTDENPLRMIIQFIDQGIPFNPLKQEDPDISLSADDREIGGLGIFMVKKSMDIVNYEYNDGQNILTICKKL